MRVRATIAAVERLFALHIVSVRLQPSCNHHTVRMLRIILTSVTGLALQYFPTLSHTRHEFRKQLLNMKVCLDFL